jgi:hypothetical protein
LRLGGQRGAMHPGRSESSVREPWTRAPLMTTAAARFMITACVREARGGSRDGPALRRAPHSRGKRRPPFSADRQPAKRPRRRAQGQFACSIAATGSGLAVYVVSAECGFPPRRRAPDARCVATSRQPAGREPDAPAIAASTITSSICQTGRRT